MANSWSFEVENPVWSLDTLESNKLNQGNQLKHSRRNFLV